MIFSPRGSPRRAISSRYHPLIDEIPTGDRGPVAIPSFEVSPSNIIEQTWETLPANEQLQFEEHKEQLIQEARATFLANFKVDRNNKVV
jgi:hypothetical protein